MYLRYIDANGTTRQWWNHATRTYSTYDEAGQVTTSRAYTAAENAAADAAAAAAAMDANAETLRAKATTALAANATYLGIGTPTNAQNLAQIRALTRQVQALIRLEVRALSDTAGT